MFYQRLHKYSYGGPKGPQKYLCGLWPHIYNDFPDKLRKKVVGLVILGFEHLGPGLDLTTW